MYIPSVDLLVYNLNEYLSFVIAMIFIILIFLPAILLTFSCLDEI